MTAYVIPAFQGMAPRFAESLLQPQQASFAANLKATSGELRGYRSIAPVATGLPPTTRKIKKLYYPGLSSFIYYVSDDVGSDVVQSPLANDAFNRIYYTELGHPPQLSQLSTYPVQHTNLGLIRPTIPPTVTPSGGAAPDDIRAYTYVEVSTYGEESAPAPAAIAVGLTGATWTIGLPVFGSLDPHAVFVDIYRSATGQSSSGNYFKVGRVSAGITSFVDGLPSDQVPLQTELTAFDNDPPLSTLYGLVQHSSGALVGFSGRSVCFSIPFLPHAWPEAFRFTVPFEVVGLASVSNAIIAMTKGHPTILVGDQPEIISLVNLSDVEPCLSKRSIIVVSDIAIYASSNGLIGANLNGIAKLTNDIVTQEEWATFNPAQLVSVKHGPWYIGFTTPSTGISIALPPYEPVSIVNLDRYDNVTAIDVDDRDGSVLVVQGGKVGLFDQVQDRRFAVTFRSKQFVSEKPINMGAIQIRFVGNPETDAQKDMRTAAIAYNSARFAQRDFETIGGYLIDGDDRSDHPIPAFPLQPPPPGRALGGEPLYDINALSGATQMRVTVTGDEMVRYSRVITDEKVHKMPSGYKASRWQIELSGSAELMRVVMAETAKECAVA